MIELIAALLTITCVVLLRLNNRIGWIFSILGSVGYSMVFYDANLYGQIILQLVFILQAFNGWAMWNEKTHDTHIKSARRGIIVKTIGYISFGCWVIWMLALTKYGTRDIYDITRVVLDLYTVLLAIAGTWFLSIKIYQAWAIWIVCDVFMITLMYLSNLYWSATLYIILLINAIIAYVSWKYQYKNITKK